MDPNSPEALAQALMGQQPDPYENMHGQGPQGNVAGSVLGMGAMAGPPMAAFAKGGLSGLASQQGIQQPAWAQKTGQVLSSPEANTALGIFAGPTAKTANLAALEMAKTLATKGTSQRSIWNKTGWFQGVDKDMPSAQGGWRYEIPDDTSSTLKSGQQQLNYGNEQPAGTLLHHPDLYEAYPHLHTLPVDSNPGEGFGGVSRGGSMGVKPEMDPSDTRSVMLHEFQHEIQRKEGFMSGRSPYNLGVDQLQQQMKYINDAHDTLFHARRALGLGSMDDLADLPPDQFTNAIAAGHESASKYWGRQMDSGGFIDDIHQSADPNQKKELIGQIKGLFEELPKKVEATQKAQEQDNYFYRKQASEVEARNVQKRADYTPEQRKFRPPWATQDTPTELQKTTPPNVIPSYVKALRGG